MTFRRAAAPLLIVIGSAFAACTNGGGLGSIGGGGSPSPPPPGGIGIAIPSGKIGVEADPVWGTISGYTQNKTSQVLAFSPGVKITLKNLSSVDPHTLNVLLKTNGPPAHFPSSPSLSFSPSGNGVLGTGYASGTINPGASVSVTLSKPGIYLIGCAFHYGLGMRNVIQVVAGATPGPTASPGPGGYAIPAPTHLGAHVSEPQLVDQRGRTFSIASLRGKPLAVTFISAHCNDACPLINAQFADAARRIAAKKINARLLTVTLDPEHESPHAMRQLAQRFEADSRYWLLAGGSVADVHAIMRTFGVISVEGKHGEDDRHTTFVYVLNSRGALTQTMLASTALDDTLVDAMRDRTLVAQR
jgi:cytochrome oxidase Cu insertion factor (SCO1/SenC/PrrC family)